jgi:hypothetical protein
MKTSLRIAVIAWIAFIASTAVFAQDWTKAQKEVWQVVEDSWLKVKSGNIDGMGANIHEKYQGWNNEAPLPVNKEQMLKMYKKMNEISKLEDYGINPARIVVTDNAAVVDYYFWVQETNTVGEKKSMEEVYGKNIEFYVKEGGKWLCLGDLTVFNENKKEDSK